MYLNSKELDELNHIDLSGDTRLGRVRDLFLVSCYTGLRFSDLQQVKTKNIIADPLNPNDLYLRFKNKANKNW